MSKTQANVLHILSKKPKTYVFEKYIFIRIEVQNLKLCLELFKETGQIKSC